MTDLRTPAAFGARDLAVVLVMNLMWGLNIIAVKMAVDTIAPLTAGFLRQLIVLLVCLPALKVVPGRMRALTALGLLSGGLFYVFVNFSLAVSDNVGALAIAGQLGVPFSLIGAILVFRERIHWPRMVGIALSLGGVMLLVFDPGAGKEWLGMLLTAASSAVWAMSSLIQRTLRGVRVLTIYAWIGFWGAVVLGPLALAVEPAAIRALPTLPLQSLGWVAFSAIGSTVIGQGSMSWLLQRHPVSLVVPFTLLAPVISVIVASRFFGNPITPLMLAGGAIAMVGIAVITFRTAKRQEEAA